LLALLVVQARLRDVGVLNDERALVMTGLVVSGVGLGVVVMGDGVGVD
jgi:hypothetical protein